MSAADNAYRVVTCKDCGSRYCCTPWRDYYNATTTSDGVCEPCLLRAANIHPDRIVIQAARP